MMQYLAPSDTHIINVPVVVGAEYTVPTADGKLLTRLGAVTTTTIIPVVETSTLDLPIETPHVDPGKLEILSVMLTMPTAVGMLKYRENFGVIDLMDIPATADTVRNFLGVTAYEIQDKDMDLEGKYLALYNVFINDFHIARQANPYLTKLFGDLISVYEALALAPTLIIRIDKKRATENGDVTRFGEAKDLENLLESLRRKRDDLLGDLEEFVEVEVLNSVAILQFVPMYNFATGGAT